jgi:radical SAM protein with 4Fe4S-binding SPASM domain
MDFLEWAKDRKLPSSLQTREGWGKLFEYHRSLEPHVHQIEPTNFCPYSCIMCPRDKYMKRKIGYMEVEVYKKIIDEINTYRNSQVNEIELFHFGESLFHPNIYHMIKYANNLKLVLSVNPQELNKEKQKKLLESNPYKIILSLDSMTEESYKKIRGKHADSLKAINNIKGLLETKSLIKNSSIIVVRVIDMSINNSEIQAFTNYWKAYECVIEIRKFFAWNKEEYKELGKVEKYPPYMPCPFSWQYVAVQWNGDVVPCCRDYNGELVMGNIKNESLKSIWNGASYKEFRHKMASGKGLATFCEDCLKIYYNEG